MTGVFADTFYYLALMSRRDAHRVAAVEASRQLSVKIVTTDFILVELLNAASAIGHRGLAADLAQHLLSHPGTVVVPASRELLATGLALYRGRPDKEWSLTDCLSFVVMQEEGLTEALTGDQHFEQAGFRALLR